MPIIKGKRILIIDDNEDITNLFKIFLEHDGFQVDSYTDPIDVLYSFRKNIYDLVLLDLKMPKMDGMLLYKKMKNIDPTLLFCFITANKEYIQILKNSIPDIEKIVIYKPILLSELHNKVHFLLLANEQREKKQLLTIL